MKIKNRVIETEFLLKANPEEVYRYLLDDKNKDLRYTEFVLSELIKRKEKLIDLAIAQVADDENIFKKLYAYNDRALRIAILENNRNLFGHVNPFSDQILRKSWLTKDQFLQILKDQNFAHEKVALFSNSSFNLFSLEDVYNKEKPYNELTEDEWFEVLHATSLNPNIKKEPNLFDGNHVLDGMTAHHEKQTITKIWLIANTCTVKEKYGRILKDLITHINFDLPVEEFPEHTKEEEDKMSKAKPENFINLNRDWFSRLKNKKINFLHLLLERWKGKEHDSKNDQFVNENGQLRYMIASKAIQTDTHDDDIKLYLKDHPDLDVRQGYYSRVTFSHRTSSEEIQEYYEKDKEAFLSTVIYNDSIYINYKGSHVKVRNKIYNLLRENDNISYQLNDFYRRAEQLSDENPTYYSYETLSLYDEVYEDEDDNLKSLTSEEKFKKIQDEMRVLNNEIQNNNNASKVEKNLSDLNYKFTEIIEDINKKSVSSDKKIDQINDLITTGLKYIFYALIVLALLVIFI